MINRYVSGETAVAKQAARANFFNPALVATPDTAGRLVSPATLTSSLGDVARAKILRDRRGVEKVSHVYLVLVTPLLYYIGDIKLALTWLAFNILTSTYFFLDNRRLQSAPSLLIERASFYGWLHSKAPPYVYGAAVLLAAMGVAQLLLVLAHGTNADVLEAYGLYFLMVTEQNQWWRVLTGPLLHGGAAHWISNFVMAIALAYLCGPLLKQRTILVFLVCGTTSFLLVYLTHRMIGLDGDGLIGASGGLGGLIGWLIASNFRHRRLYPDAFYLTTMFFACVAMIIVPLLSSMTSFLCHLFGMTIGVLWNFLIPTTISSPPPDKKSPPNPHPDQT